MGSPLRVAAFVIALTFIGWSGGQAALDTIEPTPVPLPGGSAGIGFDDLGYDAERDRVLVPAGRAGSLDLIDPTTLTITQISGFSAQENFGGGHGEGTTSVDSGR